MPHRGHTEKHDLVSPFLCTWFSIPGAELLAALSLVKQPPPPPHTHTHIHMDEKRYSIACARRGGVQVAGWTVDRKTRVRFAAYPHWVWAL